MTDRSERTHAVWLFLSLLSSTTVSLASAESDRTEHLYVTGGEAELSDIAGSAHIIDQTQLEQFEYTDIHQVIGHVPGVYVRTEEGYGLRPNIGMRGAAAERSQKITLLEDGLLIGPAPYSAPAAYYFPNVARMEAVEVFKGPVAIQYGPNTIGGAVNLVTTSVPQHATEQPAGVINSAIGSDQTGKLHAHIGQSGTLGQWQAGWLLEGLHYRSDGFKTIDKVPDKESGFERNDLRVKLQLTTPPTAPTYQQWTLKLGYANEHANETYLGLTDADFDADPYRRYAASQLDNIETDHHQVQLHHLIEPSEALQIKSALYHHRFSRDWLKFEDFHQSQTDPNDPLANALFSIKDVLQNPQGILEQRYYELLTGERNSDGSELQKLDLTNNARDYRSQGIESRITHTQPFKQGTYEWVAGIRFHHDWVERDHTINAYNMVEGLLVHDGIERSPKLVNRGETDAWALFLNNTFTLDRWVLAAGLRGESIRSTLTEDGQALKHTESILLPGAGALYHVNDQFDLLLGVYRGFSANSPGSAPEIEPETSVNWEFGGRYRNAHHHAEAILFFNDYRNLLGTCRASDTSCSVNENFNGGEVEIAGLELLAGTTLNLAAFRMPLSITYTYTESAFQSSFQSSFPQWGDVEQGDELPYLPDHQLRAEIGLSSTHWDWLLAAQYNGEMREVAGNSHTSEDYLVFDLATHFWYSSALRYQFKVTNLLDETALVARRPFGARPNRPRSFELSVKYLFD